MRQAALLLVLAPLAAAAACSDRSTQRAPAIDVDIQPDVDETEIRAFYKTMRLRLPRYEDIIKRYAETHDFDWRLIVAIIYQESHFDPLAASPAGPRGLMQLAEGTAREMGVDNRLDPEQSIKGGVAYLDKLHKRFGIARELDRTLIAMASYNVGLGHVYDARRLAEEQGTDPESWLALREVMPLLTQEEVYSRMRHGYARGDEPVEYIAHVCNWYVLLKARQCKRRKALEDALLGAAPDNPQALRELVDSAEGPLSYSHPVICATRNCDVLRAAAP